MKLAMNDSPLTRFCALEYRPEESSGPSALERVIIVFLCTESGALRVLSHQDWRTIVQSKDRDYVRDLLDDFKERARSSPEALFQQAASLSVGPVVTYAVGSATDLKSSMELLDVCGKMADL